MKLNFKKWLESAFGLGGTQEPEPSEILPLLINKIQNQAFPSYNVNPTDPLIALINKKYKKKYKR